MNENIIDRFNSGVPFEELYQKDIATQYCVLSALKNAKGHDYRVTRSSLVRRVQLIWYWHISKTDKPPGDRKIRNTIRELRQEGALICSTGGKKGGYWLATSYKEVKAFINSEYRSRALDMLYTSSRMLSAAGRQFGGQRNFQEEYNKAVSMFEHM